MPAARSRADSIAAFLTGAASAGAAQADPAASLGGYCSGNRAGGLPHILHDALIGVRVDFVSAANGIGTGTIDAVDANTLRWTPPAGTPGSLVGIANGETKLLEGGTTDNFVVVARTSSSSLAGSCSLRTLDATFNDIFGGANKAVGAGKTYRCVCLKNGSSQAVKNLLVWRGTCTHTVKIGKESPASQPDGAFQTIANETTAPAAVTFYAPTSAVHVDVLSIPLLRPSEQIGIWIERDLAAATAIASARLELHWSYTAIG